MNQEKEPQTAATEEEKQPADSAPADEKTQEQKTAEAAADGQTESAGEKPEEGQSSDGPASELKEEKIPFYQKEKFRHGSAATALTAVFIVVVVLLNVIVGKLTDKYPSLNLDMTKNASNTLSAEAVKVVDQVKIPATIYVCATKEAVENNSYGSDYSLVATLTGKISERNSNIKVEYVDLDKNPTFATEYKSDNIAAGDVIVKTDKRYRVLTSTDLFDTQYSSDYTTTTTYSNVDSALASALNTVISDVLPVASFDTGHSEKLDSTGYTSLLKGNSFETKTFSLLTDKIPDKTQLLVLGCPSTDLTDDEIKKLESFLSDTGLAADRSLVVTFSAGETDLPKLSAFLKEWGLQPESAKAVVETDAQKYVANNPLYLLGSVQTTLSLGRSGATYNNLILPDACPVNVTFENSGSKSTFALVKSNDTSYLYKNGDDQAKAEQQKSAQTIAALSQDSVQSGGKTYHANVVAMGSTMMYGSDIIGTNLFANSSYLIDLSKYATGTSNSSTQVTTTSHELYAKDITLSTGPSMFLGLGVFTILIPLAVLVAGIVVFRKRRSL